MQVQLNHVAATRTPFESVVCEKDFAEATKKAAPVVLVVDDERLVRWSVGETLRDRGIDVHEAGDAASALRQFEAGDVDLVLLDVYLPDSHDLGVLAAMRKSSPVTPIMLMTAHGGQALAERARRMGAFMVLDKPFDLDNLGVLVECALTTRLA